MNTLTALGELGNDFSRDWVGDGARKERDDSCEFAELHFDVGDV